MRISFTCPKCKAALDADTAAAGTRVPCRHCGAGVEVPLRTGPGPGTTVGGFRIERLIGEGGMGQVYVARQLSLDRDVALKILPSALSRDGEQVQRFIQEVRLLARLEHPNIVTAHEAGQDQGVLFMAMAYVKGESLEEKLRRDGALREKEALRIALKIARALAYAWGEHRLLHRDVKPSNILIDAKGEPKLADLGLSKTVGAKGAGADGDMVVGTPNYMSPEQAQGLDVDARSDMYSLGATLYHAVTGQMPFAGADALEVLRRQVNERLPDPRTFAPDLSEPCLAVLETMLAKSPAQRHASWEALIGDLERVRAGRPPTGRPLVQGDSVMVRAKDVRALVDARKVVVKAPAAGPRPKSAVVAAPAARRGFPVGAAVAALLVVALALGVHRLLRRHRAEERLRPVPPSQEELNRREREGSEALRTAALTNGLAEVARMLAMDPPALDGARRRLDELAPRASGTEWTNRVSALQQELQRRRKAAADAFLAKLTAQASELAGRGEHDAALALVRSTKLPFPALMSAARDRLAAELEKARADAAALARQRAEEALRRAHEGTAALLLRQDFAGARAAAVQAAADPALSAQTNETAHLARMTEATARIAEVVLATFTSEVGRTVAVPLSSGTESWEIVGVRGNVVKAQRLIGAGYMERTFGYEDLAIAERFRRLGTDTAPERCLMRGLVAFQAGRLPVATVQFRASAEALGAALATVAEEQERRAAESAAEQAYDALLRLAGLAPDPAASVEDVARAVRRRSFGAAEALTLRGAAAAFRQQFGETAWGAKRRPVVDALERAGTAPREIDAARLERALEELRAANPEAGEFAAGEVAAEDGTALSFEGRAGLADLKPLAGLPFRSLNLAKTGVRDLGPLAGLPLERLDLSGAPVRDLAPLLGLPLRELRLAGCPVDSVAPLKGAPLESLDLSGTRVTTVMDLSGAPLRRVSLAGAPVESIRGVSAPTLESLDISNCGKVDTLLSLKTTRLRRLVLDGTAVRDLSALRGLPLEELSLAGCRGVTDLKPLEGMAALRRLNLDSCAVSDLKPLAALPLEQLQLVRNEALRDLGPLAGTKLRYLWLTGTPVSDLAPLKGLPLVQLDASHTAVTDLAPLAGLPLESLSLEGCGMIRDLAPVSQMTKLRAFVVPHQRLPPALRHHASIREIGWTSAELLPAAEFWQRLDAERAMRREGGAPHPDGPPGPRRP